jgi:hypothetical protein
MKQKEFHDKVFYQNSIPIEMTRAILTDQPLNKGLQVNLAVCKLKAPSESPSGS